MHFFTTRLRLSKDFGEGCVATGYPTKVAVKEKVQEAASELSAVQIARFTVSLVELPTVTLFVTGNGVNASIDFGNKLVEILK